jgi:hypothetical protein
MSIDKQALELDEYGTKNKLVLGSHRFAWIPRRAPQPAAVLSLLCFLHILYHTQEANANYRLEGIAITQNV